MRRRDVVEGMTVYHRIYTHLGPGEVKAIRARNGLERLFERGSDTRIVVKFVGVDTETHCRLTELRTTPNRKKIRDMVKLYADRGDVAIDGGDRLILPRKESDQ